MTTVHRNRGEIGDTVRYDVTAPETRPLAGWSVFLLYEKGKISVHTGGGTRTVSRRERVP